MRPTEEKIHENPNPIPDTGLGETPLKEAEKFIKATDSLYRQRPNEALPLLQKALHFLEPRILQNDDSVTQLHLQILERMGDAYGSLGNNRYGLSCRRKAIEVCNGKPQKSIEDVYYLSRLYISANQYLQTIPWHLSGCNSYQEHDAAILNYLQLAKAALESLPENEKKTDRFIRQYANILGKLSSYQKSFEKIKLLEEKIKLLDSISPREQDEDLREQVASCKEIGKVYLLLSDKPAVDYITTRRAVDSLRLIPEFFSASSSLLFSATQYFNSAITYFAKITSRTNGDFITLAQIFAALATTFRTNSGDDELCKLAAAIFNPPNSNQKLSDFTVHVESVMVVFSNASIAVKKQFLQVFELFCDNVGGSNDFWHPLLTQQSIPVWIELLKNKCAELRLALKPSLDTADLENSITQCTDEIRDLELQLSQKKVLSKATPRATKCYSVCFGESKCGYCSQCCFT